LAPGIFAPQGAAFERSVAIAAASTHCRWLNKNYFIGQPLRSDQFGTPLL